MCIRDSLVHTAKQAAGYQCDDEKNQRVFHKSCFIHNYLPLLSKCFGKGYFLNQRNKDVADDNCIGALIAESRLAMVSLTSLNSLLMRSMSSS